MSSNTLRGVGQEGDGEDTAAKGEKAVQDGAQASPPNDVHGSRQDGRQDGSPPESGVALRGPSEEAHEQRRVRSLDSTVPGTRSLDARVPDAHPSLDAKNPALAATLIGIPAPVISGRGQGTVQGRDVHLPVEAQRMAGMRPIAATPVAERTASSIAPERSEPTRADPMRAALAAKVAAENSFASDVTRSRQTPSDLSAHTPWYDQDTSETVYEDERPNVLGRIAIAAAVAAALSVVLFAIVRLHGQASVEDETEIKASATPPPVLVAPPPAEQPQVLPPTDPSPVPVPGRAEAETPAGASRAAEPDSPEIVAVTPAAGKAASASSSKHRTSSGQPPFSSPSIGAMQSGSSQPPQSMSSGYPTASPVAPASSAPTTSAPRPQPTEPIPAATPAAGKAPAMPGEKPRGKATYDPDSTLPLTID